ncbi:MAG: biopolymer transporter ExbD [Treponema sp.]|jgi:biopolymer transport protein ExbD|nr:biopolymer transporter ExbD [Treponema sp.]
MRIHREKKNPFEASSASSDIAFLLIIYFIVIAGFSVNRGLLLNLPEKDSTRSLLKEDILRFEMDHTGAVSVNGSLLDKDGAEREIRQAVAERPNIAVVLEIAPAAPWQNVVSFVELAQNLQVDSFSFTMKEEQ